MLSCLPLQCFLEPDILADLHCFFLFLREGLLCTKCKRTIQGGLIFSLYFYSPPCVFKHTYVHCI